MRRSQRTALVALALGASALQGVSVSAQDCGVEACDHRPCNHSHHMVRDDYGLLDRLDDFACRLPQLPQRKRSILSAFKVELSLQHRANCDSSNCASEPTCGTESTGGCESASSNGCDCKKCTSPQGSIPRPLPLQDNLQQQSPASDTPRSEFIPSPPPNTSHKSLRHIPPTPLKQSKPLPQYTDTIPQIPRPSVAQPHPTRPSSVAPDSHKQGPANAPANAPANGTVKGTVPELREVPKTLPTRTPSLPTLPTEDSQVDPFRDDTTQRSNGSKALPASHTWEPGSPRVYKDAFSPQANLEVSRSSRMHPETPDKFADQFTRGTSRKPRPVMRSISDQLQEIAANRYTEVVPASALQTLPPATHLRSLPVQPGGHLEAERLPVNPLR